MLLPVLLLGTMLLQTPAPTAPKSGYTGEVVTFELNNVDLRDFFKVISELGGAKFQLDPDVGGPLSVSAKEVPWDQVLDEVVNQRQLGIQRSGDRIRVSSKPVEANAGRVVLDLEVLENGKLLGKSRLTTISGVPAVYKKAEVYSLEATPTQIAPNKIELDVKATVYERRFSSKVVVSKEATTPVIWESGSNAYLLRVTLVAIP